MPSEATIRMLVEADAAAYAALRRESLVDAPLAFASSPDDDLSSTAASVAQRMREKPESVIYGAFDDGLVGAAGIFRDRHRKSSHKVHLWGMYLRPSHRRRGIAVRLARALVEHAEGLPGLEYVHLSVTGAAPEARSLYAALGSRSWGIEPDSLREGGEAVSEEHMVVRLRASRGGDGSS